MRKRAGLWIQFFSILLESAYDEGYLGHEHQRGGFITTKALKAAALLQLIPERRPPLAGLKELPKTRQELWDNILIGMEHENNPTQLQMLGNALLKPIELSEKERQAFNASVHKWWDQLTDSKAKVFFLVLGTCPTPYNWFVFRAIMKTVVRCAPMSLLHQLARQDNFSL